MAEPSPRWRWGHERRGDVHAAASIGRAAKMLGTLGRGWRVVATGVCFAAFGLGGLVFGATMLPWLRVLVHPRDRRTRWARLSVHYFFRAFIAAMRGLGVISYRVEGVERLRRAGLLVMANHPSLIDVVFLGALMPRADCVVKSTLLRNPFTAGPVRAAGYICNRDGSEMMTQTIASVRAGNNVILFPEGTRTPAAGDLHLRPVAAYVAVLGRLNITPVVIRCAPAVLKKGMPWYGVPSLKPHFQIHVRGDIDVLPFLHGADNERVAARRLRDYLTQYFAKELRDG